MPSVFDAHIFKRRQVGEREEVRLRLFNIDGSPADVGGGGGSEEPSAPSEPVSPWIVAYASSEIALPSSTDFFGPELLFTVGASGMALISASGWFWTDASPSDVAVMLDDAVEIASGSVGGFSPVMQTVVYPTSSGNARANFIANGPIPTHYPTFASPGIMMVMTPGEHKIQWRGNAAGGSTGKVKEIRLAAMPLD